MQLVCQSGVVVAHYDDGVTVPMAAFPGATLQPFAGTVSDLARIGDPPAVVPGMRTPDDRPYAAPPPTPQTLFTPRAFMALFTSAEQAAIFKARQTSVDVDMFITLAMAGNVDVTNAEVIADINALVPANLLTADRAKQILAGQAAPTSAPATQASTS